MLQEYYIQSSCRVKQVKFKTRYVVILGQQLSITFTLLDQIYFLLKIKTRIYLRFCKIVFKRLLLLLSNF